MAHTPFPGTTDRRIDALLAVLSDNAMIVISGAKIAREIGVTRLTVWRWVEKLRALGVRVKGHPRTGYQVEKVPDILAPTILHRRLHPGPLGKRIFHFFKIDSTNSVAMALGEKGEPHGTVVIAEEQTAGRGRAGHQWHSEKTNGIYMTVLLRPPVSPQQAPLITLVAGLAVREAILEQTSLTPDLRWPNDLLFGRKKFCGILTEMNSEQDQIHFVAVGIGINVNHDRIPGELSKIATSLRIETQRVQSRVEIVARLLRHLDSYYNRFLLEGPGAIVARFSEVSSYAHGKRVRIETASETYTGTTEGLEPEGLLRVRRDDGRILPVISGTLSEAD
ncbi:MAG TPA: biotin--[acetyl-CoA-carboxylase] ligase [Candidatus Acidoferrales bacterium]|jgi:BirA family biotin operon repressor/biotin-[acetyl-CoA-carboxylase] ligase|nr:biotin--[acetyl-CoA-carboxylase] ligase [Candidatus Acidoferrales bacterium]